MNSSESLSEEINDARERRLLYAIFDEEIDLDADASEFEDRFFEENEDLPLDCRVFVIVNQCLYFLFHS